MRGSGSADVGCWGYGVVLFRAEGMGFNGDFCSVEMFLVEVIWLV